MVHLGCHLSSAKGFENMGKEAMTIGADTLQFFTRNPRGGAAKDINPEDLKRFLDIARNNNFAKIIAHAPYTLNPCSKDEKIRDFAYITMKDDIRRMELMPGNYYNFHPGSHVGQGVEAGIQMIADLLNRIVTEDQTTVVLLETMAGKGSEIGGRFEELAAIIEKVNLSEKIGICMDTCHINDAGYDIVNNLDGVLSDFNSIIGINRLKAIHINDSMNPLGSRKDRHARIGEGCIGIKAIGEIINHPFLQGLPFILETPQEDIWGYAKEIKLLKEMEL